MTSKHLVDPELQPVLDLIPTLDFTIELLPMVRANTMSLPTNPDLEKVVTCDVRSIPGPAGSPDVGVSIYLPVGIDGPLPCILHIHGGGFVAGSSADLRSVHFTLANAAKCAIVSVDYRLAPETQFPGAIEDCYAALAWLVAEAPDLGIDPDRIGVMGESAGGGLAAALALLVRDRAEYRLAFQHLVYPMLDDRTCITANPHPFTGQFIWNASSNVFGWTSLLGMPPGSPDVSPYAAAARAEDLGNLPPTFIGTGALDLFLEENLEYARRLTRSGVCVELHVYPGAFHAFNIAPDAQIAANARRDSLNALIRALYPENCSGKAERS